MRLVPSVAAILLSVLIVPEAAAAISTSEREALVALYAATGGDTWIDRSNWLGPGGTECSWYGITCDAGETTVETIELRSNHVSGALPPEIGQLSGLETLDLSWNQIRGPIPASIGDLRSLRNLDLSDNDLQLPFPSSFFTLTTLETLDLAGNRFNGPIPPEIGSLNRLVRVDLSLNGFIGAVPMELTSLTSLTDGQSDFRFNAIRAGDSGVRSFLEAKQVGGDWESTQTVPPEDVLGGQVWDPIAYTENDGHYRLEVSNQSGEGEPVYFSSASKTSDSYGLRVVDIVGELRTTIRTVTLPHGRQKNTLISEPSDSSDFTQFGFAPEFPFFALGVPPEPLVQIGGVAQNETFFTVVNYGGEGETAFIESDGDFFNLTPTEFFLDAFSTRRVDVTSIAQPPGEYEGTATITADALTVDDIIVPISLISLPAAPDPDGLPERRRVDLVSGRTPLAATATFRNDGVETLTGVVESDVPWIVPVTESLTIEPGTSTQIEFTIDTERLPDSFGEEGVSFSGNLRLVYPDRIPAAAKRAGPMSQHTTEVSTTLATIVSTAPPPVTQSEIPALEQGERRYLIPGLLDGTSSIGELFSDLSIANARGSTKIPDLQAFFSTVGETNQSRLASFNELDRRTSVLLGAPVRTVFGEPGRTGSIQIRSQDADHVLMFARLLRARDRGLFGTSLPVFRVDRAAAPGETVHLVGFASGSPADLYVQAASEAGASVIVRFLGPAGNVVQQAGPIMIGGWDSSVIEEVPDDAVTAIIENRQSSAGPITAHAIAGDPVSGDAWVIVDWASYRGEPLTTPMILPFARRQGASETTGSRRRAVVRPGTAEEELRTTLHLSAFNVSESKSAIKFVFKDVNGTSSERIVTLDPRETVTFTDLLGALFDEQGSVEGWLELVPLRGEIGVGARIVTTGNGPGTVGSTIPLHPRGSGMRLGERRSIAAIDDSRRETILEEIGATWRTRISLLETTGEPVTVSATMRAPTGQSLAAATVSRIFEVEPNQLLRLGAIAQAIMGDERETGVDDLHDLQVELKVVEGNGAVLVLTETIENATGDSLIRFD